MAEKFIDLRGEKVIDSKVEKHEFLLPQWGNVKIELKEVEGGFDGGMKVNVDTKMGWVSYRRSVSIRTRADAAADVVRFELKIKDKTGQADKVDEEIRRIEFNKGVDYWVEIRRSGEEWEFHSSSAGAARSYDFEAEAIRFLKKAVVKQHLEEELAKLRNLPEHATEQVKESETLVGIIKLMEREKSSIKDVLRSASRWESLENSAQDKTYRVIIKKPDSEEEIGEINVLFRKIGDIKDVGFLERISPALREHNLSKEGKIAQMISFYPFQYPQPAEKEQLSGKGVGTAVLDLLLKKCESEGAAGVYFQMPSESLLVLLEKAGFQEIEKNAYFKKL
jgi:hypothetical protein